MLISYFHFLFSPTKQHTVSFTTARHTALRYDIQSLAASFSFTFSWNSSEFLLMPTTNYVLHKYTISIVVFKIKLHCLEAAKSALFALFIELRKHLIIPLFLCQWKKFITNTWLNLAIQYGFK